MKLKQMVVRVVGTGSFPIDMLRYCRLAPESGEDAGRIAQSFGDPEPVGEVSLVGWLHGRELHFPSSINPDRWRSFGWRVTLVEVDGRVTYREGVGTAWLDF